MNREKIEKFKKEKCSKCKNKDYTLCEIRKDINGNLKCLYEEEKEK